MIDESQRVRIVRALLRLTGRELAAKLEVTPNAVSAWENGHRGLTRRVRVKLGELCQEGKISFLPSGMPVPTEDLMYTHPKEAAND